MKVDNLDLAILVQSQKLELAELIAYHNIDSEDICLICRLLFDNGEMIIKEIRERLLSIKGEVLKESPIMLQISYELLKISDNDGINTMHLTLLSESHKLNKFTEENLSYMYHVKPLTETGDVHETVSVFITKHYSPIDYDS